MEYKNELPVKQWSEGERPREKLLMKGRSALSDVELLAILLGTGNRRMTAVELAQWMLRESGNNLVELSNMCLDDLMAFEGVGEVKAMSIVAAMELCRRRRSSSVLEKMQIQSSKEVFELMQPQLGDASYEEFWIILLNRANRIMQQVNISEGGFSGTVADPKKIFHIALAKKSSSIILCHNHPSGNVKPSEADIQLTKKLRDAGILLDLPVLDHIIFGQDRYFSFADEAII